jgi:rod shape-determining protein MreB
MDEAIVNYIKKKYNLMIGERTAELIKISVGSAFPLDQERKVEVKGRDLISGIPKTLEVTSEEIREALEEPLKVIVDAVKVALERTPPELASDIVDKGIVLAGGGASVEKFGSCSSSKKPACQLRLQMTHLQSLCGDVGNGFGR